MKSTLFAALVGLATLGDATAALTLADAQRAAIARSRSLQGHDAAVGSALSMATAAAQLPDPVLKAGIDNLPIEGGDKFSLTRDFMTMRRIGVMQELTREEKRDARRERYEREADRQRAEKLATVASIRRDTALAWLDVAFAERTLAETTRFASAAKAEITAADASYRAGRGQQAAVFAARSAAALAEDKRLEAERRLRTARIALARWTGTSDTPVAALPDMAHVHLETVSLETHLLQHPDLLVLERQAEVAEAESRIASAAKRPDWTVEASYQQRGSAFGNMVSIGVSVPFPWDRANRQEREVAAKLALVEEARAKRDEMLREHVAEVAAMLDEWRAGRERQARLASDVVPAAVQRTGAMVAEYAGNRATLDDVLGARRGEFEARLQLLQLEQEVARLWARLEFLLPPEAMEASR